MKSFIKYISLTIVIMGLMSSCSKPVQEEERASVQVTVMEAGMLQTNEQSRFSGKIASVDKSILSTKVMGQIEYLPKAGQQVKKGEVVVRIRNQELYAKKAAAKANLNRAEANLNNLSTNQKRIKSLHTKGSATQLELDNINTSVKVAEAELAAAEHRIMEINELISYSVISSPISGYVSEKFANISDLATPGQPLIALESNDRLEIHISIPEYEIGQLKEGMELEVEVPSSSMSSFTTQVRNIIPSSEFSGSQFVAIASIESKTEFKPGMFVRVLSSSGQTQKIIIPRDVIYERGQLNGIYTINAQGESMLRWIRLGKEYPEGVEVLSGLQKGEQIITSFEGKPVNGVPVEINNQKAS